MTAGRSSFRFQRPADFNDLEILRGEDVHKSIDQHIHPSYEVVLIDDGYADFTLLGEHVRLGTGQFLVVNAGDVHAVAAGPDGCSFRTLYIPVHRVQQAARALGHCDAPPAFPPRAIDDAIVAGLLGKLHAAFEFGAPHPEIDALLQGVLSLLVSRCARGVRAADGTPQIVHDGVSRAREFIDEHFAEAISLDELAQVAGLSKYHLIRVFRAELGMPPHAYQNALRVARAREQLLDGRSAGDVALGTGFADQSHFTRRFKRLVGLAPAEYARGTARGRRNQSE